MNSQKHESSLAAKLRSMPTDLEASGIKTFADLFCGIGGFHYAGEALGMKCVFACDVDEDVRKQYKHNFDITPKGDIMQLQENDIPNHDLLFAGFPCQPFSIIGNLKARSDARGTLMDEIIRVLGMKAPRGFVLENVRQLATIQDGEVMDFLLEKLKSVGYFADWRVLNALDFDLPQKRERTIIVGFSEERTLKTFSWPNGKKLKKTLADILENGPDKKYFVSDRIKEKRHKAHTPGVTPSIWHENKAGNISSHPFSCALRASASYNYLLVDGKRRLTPREQLRLQGFPERFEVVVNDSQIRKQTGNAIPVPMARATIREVLYAAAQNADEVSEARAVSA